MKRMNRSLRLYFAFSIALSVGFPAGILGIVFGASSGIVPLLVAGIIFTVAGFYVMPLLWLRYAERRRDRRVLEVIDGGTSFSLSRLCELTGCTEEDARARVKRLMATGFLPDFSFRDDILLRQGEGFPDPFASRQCPRCAAEMVYGEKVFRCEYCGHREEII